MESTVFICNVCKGKRYLVCELTDGRKAIERCDTCSADTMTDADAATRACEDGYRATLTYPFIVLETPETTKPEQVSGHCPGGFVVNNGSNARAFVSASMPCPVSLTETTM